jgi:hypothetical protein
MRLAGLAVMLLAGFPFSASADPKLDALIAAYPDRLASYTDSELIWKDGSRMPLGSAHDSKPFAEMLDQADIRDQFAIPYPLATTPLQAPATDEDPGRIRNDAFFLKMYGDCRKGEVTPVLRAVPGCRTMAGARFAPPRSMASPTSWRRSRMIWIYSPTR